MMSTKPKLEIDPLDERMADYIDIVRRAKKGDTNDFAKEMDACLSLLTNLMDDMKEDDNLEMELLCGFMQSALLMIASSILYDLPAPKKSKRRKAR